KSCNKPVTIDEEIFALGVEQEPSKNNESKVRQKILLKTECRIEDYKIFDKVLDQVPEKLKEDIKNEFTRDAPELTRQNETNPMSKIKKIVTKNNTGMPDNSKGKDKDYRSCLENKLRKKNPYQETVNIKLKEEQIDIEWDRLSNAIQEVANKHIPWSKAKKIDFSCKKVIPKCKYHKELKLLHKICKYKKEKGIAKISHSECSRFNIQIEQINEKNIMEILPLPNTWNLVNVDELRK
ncbi:32001_t:CDS:2, partial [Gigaspora margarita]